MGQRAVVAVKQNYNVVVTTVQWATMAPYTYSLAINMIMQEENLDYKDAVKKITNKITGSTHISSLDVVSKNDVENSKFTNYTLINDYNDVDKVVAISGAHFNREDMEIHNNIDTHDKLLNIVTNHYHAQDGISVIIDYDQDDLQVEFYMDNDYGDFNHTRITPDSDFFQSVTRDNVTELIK